MISMVILTGNVRHISEYAYDYLPENETVTTIWGELFQSKAKQNRVL